MERIPKMFPTVVHFCISHCAVQKSAPYLQTSSNSLHVQGSVILYIALYLCAIINSPASYCYCKNVDKILTMISSMLRYHVLVQFCFNYMYNKPTYYSVMHLFMLTCFLLFLYYMTVKLQLSNYYSDTFCQDNFNFIILFFLNITDAMCQVDAFTSHKRTSQN